MVGTAGFGTEISVLHPRHVYDTAGGKIRLSEAGPLCDDPERAENGMRVVPSRPAAGPERCTTWTQLKKKKTTMVH